MKRFPTSAASVKKQRSSLMSPPTSESLLAALEPLVIDLSSDTESVLASAAPIVSSPSVAIASSQPVAIVSSPPAAIVSSPTAAIVSSSPATESSTIMPTVIRNRSKGFTLEDMPLHHYYLGGTKFITVSDYTKAVRIHLISYVYDGTFFHPTKCGITISPLAFRNFMDSTRKFKGRRNVHTFNDELFVSFAPDGKVWNFQRLFTDSSSVHHLTQSVSLHENQFELLCKACKYIWRSVYNLKFGSVFQETVLNYRGSATSPSGQEADVNILGEILVDSVKHQIQQNISELFYCPECKLPPECQPQNQLGHSCVSTSNSMKSLSHFKEAVAILNPKTLATDFVLRCEERSAAISKIFLQNINAKDVLCNARTIYEREW